MQWKIGTVVLLVLGFLVVAFGDAQMGEMENLTPMEGGGSVRGEIPSASIQNAGKSRKRRMSCEALSFPLPYGYMNHAACATYCFTTGQNFRGHCAYGWCKCK